MRELTRYYPIDTLSTIRTHRVTTRQLGNNRRLDHHHSRDAIKRPCIFWENRLLANGPKQEHRVRVKVFVDFWNFQISFNYQNAGFNIDWRKLGWC